MITLLEIDKLTFSYQQKKILKAIELFVIEREFIGIIGPNGSGKSTLLKNISRIITPETGFIYLDRQLLNQYSNNQLARLMAVVPQDTSVNYNFTVYDLVMMGRSPYQDRWGRISPGDREIVREALELTETIQFSDRDINELSGGERQRVIIARALAQRPQLLLLDEPTASLDINYQREIFDLLTRLNQELGLTVLVVSHDLNLSSQYCNKLVLLREGEIYKTGTPGEVMTSENIRAVYQTEVIIKNNPLTDRPYIILMPKGEVVRRNGRHKKVHLICGGGSGKELIEYLAEQGYQLSCGVLNKGDSDWEVARRLKVELVEIPPFSPIDQESLTLNQRLIAESDLVIVSSTPFGHGNLANLEMLVGFKNKKIVLFNRPAIQQRDYTGGLAREYWNLLLQAGDCYQISSIEQLSGMLDRLFKS